MVGVGPQVLERSRWMIMLGVVMVVAFGTWYTLESLAEAESKRTPLASIVLVLWIIILRIKMSV